MSPAAATPSPKTAAKVEDAASDAAAKPVVTIKKYANRRLYNTATSSYVTLDHLCGMVKQGVEFAVFDAKTGEDITRSVLTQIIVEEENKGENLLPINFLRELIRLYGGNMQVVVPNYLDGMMQAFARNQDQIAQAMQGMMQFNTNPMQAFEDMHRNNLAMMGRAWGMFAPFQTDGQADATAPAGERATPESLQAALEQQITELEEQLRALKATK